MKTTETNDKHTSKKDMEETAWIQAVRKSMLPIKHKFLFISTQGGVGKTTVIVNLAMAFAKKGVGIGLMDVNFNSPDIHRILGLNPVMKMDSKNRLLPREYSTNLKVASIEAVRREFSETGGWGTLLEVSDILQFMSNTHWTDIDHLLIDTPHGPSSRLLSVIRAIPEVKIIIVTAPNRISSDSAAEMISFFKREKVSVFGWIENMQGFLCQNCGHRQKLIGTGPVSRAVFLNEVPFLGRIPIVSNLRQFVDAGEGPLEKKSSYTLEKASDMIVQKIMTSTCIK